MSLPAEVVALSNQYLREAQLHLLQTFVGKPEAALELVHHRAAIDKTAQGLSSAQRVQAMNHASVRLRQMTYTPAVDTQPAIERLIEAARRHGEDSDPDHEVGDLQGLLRQAWELLPAMQRSLLLCSRSASDVFQGGTLEPLATSASDIDADTWDEVCEHFGLDTSFQYTAEQMLEYTNMYLLAELEEEGATPRYLSGGWEHIFREDQFLPGARASCLRFVFDRQENAIVAMQIQSRGEWVDAKAAAIADVQDSLLTANAEALEDPSKWGLESSNELPDWAVASMADAEPSAQRDRG